MNKSYDITTRSDATDNRSGKSGKYAELYKYSGAPYGKNGSSGKYAELYKYSGGEKASASTVREKEGDDEATASYSDVLYRQVLPTRYKLGKEYPGLNEAPFKKAIASVGDILTLVPRTARGFIGGLAQIGSGRTPESVAKGISERISETKSDRGGLLGIAENVALDPSTYIPVSGGASGSIIKALGKAALQGGKSALASSLYQGAGEGEIDPARVAVQTGLGIGLGLAGSGLQKSAALGAKSVSQAVAKRRALAQAANEITDAMGMPLTRGERAAAIGSKTGGGAWGAIERNIRSLPFADKPFIKLNEEKARVAGEMLETALGRPISELDDDIAKKVADLVERDYAANKAAFNAAYTEAIKKGRVAYVDGVKIADKIKKRISGTREYNKMDKAVRAKLDRYIKELEDLSKPVTEGGGMVIETTKAPLSERNVAEGYGAGMSKSVLTGGPGQALGMQASNYDTYRSVKSGIGSEIARLKDNLAVSTSGLNRQEAAEATKVLNEAYSIMKAAEMVHLRMVGGNKLANQIKAIDAAYGDNVNKAGILRATFGIGREAGERGARDAEVALDAITNPKQTQRLADAVKIVTPETIDTIKRAVVSKIVRKASTVSVIDGEHVITGIKTGALKSAIAKYRPVLKIVADPNDIKYLDDMVVAFDRANVSTINLQDPSNPSGTAGRAIVGWLLGQLGIHGGGALVGGVVGGKEGGTRGAFGGAMLGLALTAGGTRALANMATRQPQGAVLAGKAASSLAPKAAELLGRAAIK